MNKHNNVCNRRLLLGMFIILPYVASGAKENDDAKSICRLKKKPKPSSAIRRFVQATVQLITRCYIELHVITNCNYSTHVRHDNSDEIAQFLRGSVFIVWNTQGIEADVHAIFQHVTTLSRVGTFLTCSVVPLVS